MGQQAELIITSGNKYIVCWNKNNYHEDLKKVENFHFVYNENGLWQELKKNEYKGIIILAKLDWDGEFLQNFHGVEVAKKLRKDYEVRCPIYFVSSFPLKQLHNNNAQRDILTAIGHYFIPISEFYDFKFPKSEKMLDDMEMDYVRYLYCDNASGARKIIHDLNKYSLDEANSDEIKRKIIIEINRLHQVFGADSFCSVQDFNNLFPEISPANFSNTLKKASEIGHDLISKYSLNQKDINGNQKEKIKEKWKALLVDDEINKNHLLVETLENRGVEVICCANVLDAESILNEDWQRENKIMVVIADYHLKHKSDDGTELDQPVQGFTLLKDISESNRFVRLVTLSGLPRSFLTDIFNKYRIKTDLFPKQDYSYLKVQSELDILCDQIIKIGEENKEVIDFLPQTGRWLPVPEIEIIKTEESIKKINKKVNKKKAIKEIKSLTNRLRDLKSKNIYLAYRLHRYSPGYLAREKEIELRTKYFIDAYNEGKINDPVLRIPGKTGKNSIAGPAFFTYDFDMAKNNQTQLLENFKLFFIARRFTLWLKIEKNKDITEIVRLLKGEPEKNGTHTENYARQVFSTDLALSMDNFPGGLTVDEIRWFESIGHPLMCELKIIKHVFNNISKQYNTIICANNAVKKIIDKHNGQIYFERRERKNKRTGSDIIGESVLLIFDKAYFPKIKSLSHCRALTDFIYKNITPDDKEGFDKTVRSIVGIINNHIASNGESKFLYNCKKYYKHKFVKSFHERAIVGKLQGEKQTSYEGYFKTLDLHLIYVWLKNNACPANKDIDNFIQENFFNKNQFGIKTLLACAILVKTDDNNITKDDFCKKVFVENNLLMNESYLEDNIKRFTLGAENDEQTDSEDNDEEFDIVNPTE